MATWMNRRARRGLPFELILVATALLVLLGNYARQRPWMLSPERDAMSVAAPEAAVQPTTSDILIVIPSVVEATNLESFPWDRVWVNAVEQEVGQARTIGAAELTRSDVDPADWVIVPGVAAAQLDPTQTQFLHNWVEDGGVLLLEQPEGPWQAFTGQAFSGARRRETRRVTSFDGTLARADIRDDLLEMPFRTNLLLYNPANLARGRDYQVLLEIDGQPGIITRQLGRGHVYVLLFDFAELVGQLQQGVSGDDLSLPSADLGLLPAGLTTTHRAVRDPALLEANIPFADLLERHVLALLDQHRPVARLWLYPGTHRGALLVTHSEDGFGPRSRFLVDWESAADRQSTLFASAGSLTPEQLARMARMGTDIQYQWIPSTHDRAPQRTWGLRGFRPVRRPMTLREQQERLDHDLLPYGPTRVSRTPNGVWPVRWLDGFRALDAAGIALDLSWGPTAAHLSAGQATAGYLFGTGYPYRPIDANGRRFGVRVLPVALLDLSLGYDYARVRRLLVDAADRYHTTIVGDWRPDTMTLRPSWDALEGWRSAFTIAEQQELWIATATEYVDFLRQREGSRVQSTFSREERRLGIEVSLVGPATPSDEPSARTPAIAFPARYQGRPVERLTVDGHPVAVTELSQTADRLFNFLALDPGEHRVQVFYGSPVEFESP